MASLTVSPLVPTDQLSSPPALTLTLVVDAITESRQKPLEVSFYLDGENKWPAWLALREGVADLRAFRIGERYTLTLTPVEEAPEVVS
jgi:hypothetical protein